MTKFPLIMLSKICSLKLAFCNSFARKTAVGVQVRVSWQNDIFCNSLERKSAVEVQVRVGWQNAPVVSNGEKWCRWACLRFPLTLARHLQVGRCSTHRLSNTSNTWTQWCRLTGFTFLLFISHSIWLYIWMEE